MANVYKTIYDTLSAIGYPVYEQGSLGDDDPMPADLITYQLINKSDITHSDNLPTSNVVRVQVALYSTDPEIKQSADATLWAVMKPAGFMRMGGRDLPFDPSTGHYGYVCEYRIYQKEDQ